MNFGLAQYLSNDLTLKTFEIQSYSDKISDFFKDKQYGDGLKDISIGIICVSPEYEIFFKPRKPNFTKFKEEKIDGLVVVYDHVFECDVCLSYELFKKANTNEVHKIIAKELVNVIDMLKLKKIENFDIDQFQRDFEAII